MENEQKPSIQENKKKKRPVLKVLLIGLLLLLVLIVLMIPIFISSAAGNNLILSKINSSIDGKVGFKNLSIGWFKGLKLTDISFSDKPGNITASVKEISAQPKYIALLSGNIELGRTVIDSPHIAVALQKPVPGLEKKAVAEPPQKEAKGGFELPIKQIELVIKDGDFKLKNWDNKLVEFANINTNISLNPPGTPTSLNVVMDIIGADKKSSIAANGSVESKSSKWTLEKLNGNMTVETNNLDLSTLEPLLAIAGVNMQMKGNLTANFDGKIVDGALQQLDGKVNGNAINIGGDVLKGDFIKTNIFDVDVKCVQDGDKVKIEKLTAKTDWLNFNVTGVIPSKIDNPQDMLKPESVLDLDGELNCDLAVILSQLKNTAGLQKQAKLISGKLAAKFNTESAAAGKKFTANAEISGLAGLAEQKQISLSPITLNAAVTSGKSGFSFDNIDVVSSFCKLNCAGTMENLKYSADVSLSDFLSQFGQFINLGKYNLKGKIAASGQMITDAKRISNKGTVNISSFEVSTKSAQASEPQGTIDYSMSFDKSFNSIELPLLSYKGTIGQFEIKDSAIPLARMTDPMKVSAFVKVDFAKLQPFLKVADAIPANLEIKGVVELPVDVTSDSGSYKIKVSNSKITNFVLLSPGKQPFVQEQILIDFDGSVNPDTQNISIRSVKLAMAQIKLTGSFDNTVGKQTTQMKGKFDCEYDWASVSSMASQFMPSGLKLTGKRKDVIAFDSIYPNGNYDKLLANLNSTAKVGFDNAEYMGLVLGQTNVDIQVQKGFMKLAPFTTTANNGTINFGGQADFKQKPSFFTMPQPYDIIKDVQITDKMSKELLRYVNPLFADSGSVNGVCNFRCEKMIIPISGGTQNDIEIEGTFDANNVKFNGSNLLGKIIQAAGSGQGGNIAKIHPTAFILTKGFLRYDKMQIDIGNLPVIFRGVIGLNKSLKMDVSIPIGGSTRNIPLKGTVDKPDIDVSSAIIQNLPGILNEVLKK
jgi:hypothetical protein